MEMPIHLCINTTVHLSLEDLQETMNKHNLFSHKLKVKYDVRVMDSDTVCYDKNYLITCFLLISKVKLTVIPLFNTLFLNKNVELLGRTGASKSCD